MSGASLPDRALADGEFRRVIREELDATLIVEAAAGTGKTTMLVARIIALIVAGKVTLRRLISVTFTEKAAGEMRLRLRSEVEQARRAAADPVTQERLDLALAQLEEARIGTIHALAADLLRERPVESGVDPVFQVLPQDSAVALRQHAYQQWFRAMNDDPPPGVRRLLCRPPSWDGQTATQALASAAQTVIAQRYFDAPWRVEGFERDAAIDGLMAEIGGLADLFEHGTPSPRCRLRGAVGRIASWFREVQRREAVAPRDYDRLEADICHLAAQRKLWGGGSSRGMWGPSMTRDAVHKAREAVAQKVQGFKATAESQIAALLRRELEPVVDTYELLKTRTGCLDFEDLLVRTRDLLVNRPAVRDELQSRFDVVLVDEFQDTNPLQAEILLLLAAETGHSDWVSAPIVPGKLFIVGDPKQAIYRFRQADVGLYQRVKKRLCAHGGRLVYLSTSFRSVAGIQSVVNAAFSRAMAPDGFGTQSDYVPLRQVRDDLSSQPPVVALPVPRPYATRNIAQGAIATSYPDAVGAFVHWLVNHSGWSVLDDGEKVPIRPRHICLLFRNMSRGKDDLTRSYTRALESRQIAHVRVGGRSFHDMDEVSAIRNAMIAIEWPDDDLAVFSALRGPFVALDDAQLVRFKAECGRMSPTRRYALEELDASLRPVAEALGLLGELHRARNRRPIAETMTRFLRQTRAYAGVATWKAGEQRLANVLQLVDQARRAEQSGILSFRAFVERLQASAERRDALDTPMVEDTTEGVRLLTVHKAKGLEFPVVILCDLNAKLVRPYPDHYSVAEERLWVSQLARLMPVELRQHGEEAIRLSREEGIRLAYVAATRARDLLVVPTVGDEQRASWLSPLWPAIYPSERSRQHPTDAVAVGCPPFTSGDTVLNRPPDAYGRHLDTVVPGNHQPQQGAHRVVWWDPATLALGSDMHQARARYEVLADDPDGAARSRLDYANWQRHRRETLDMGRVPSQAVRSVTELARAPSLIDAAAKVRVERVTDRDPQRPTGTRFGCLVHAVLAESPLHLSGQEQAGAVGDLCSIHGRLLGADDEEIGAAKHAVLAAMGHALFQRAAASPDCRREVPVAFRLQDGTLADGVVDVAFLEVQPEAEWFVIDVKTDGDLESRGAIYRQQVAYYVTAIERATAGRAHGFILLV